MSFLMRIVLAIIILFVIEIVFVKKLKNSLVAVFPNRSSKTFRIAKWIYLLLINIYPVLLLLYWGYRKFFDPAFSIRLENSLFDYLAVYPFWTLGLLTIQTFLLFIPLDILKVLLRFSFPKLKEKIKSVSLKINFIIVFFFTLYVPARILIDYNMVSVRVKEYFKENLPPDLEGFKITFISDVQADRYTDGKRLSNFLNKVNATNPDLILIAGDLITSTPDYIQTSANYLSTLKAPYGIYSCIGDHDNWAYREDIQRSRRELTEALRDVHIPLIDNANKTIYVKNSKIGITFVTHTYSERISEEKLNKLTKNCTDCDFKIFLTHQPRQFMIDKASEDNYNLYLAGHTHGGQLSFLFPFINLSPTLFETKYVRGDFYFNDLMVTITRGLGMSIAPIRYNSTPEITVIVLRDKETNL